MSVEPFAQLTPANLLLQTHITQEEIVLSTQKGYDNPADLGAMRVYGSKICSFSRWPVVWLQQLACPLSHVEMWILCWLLT